MVSPRPFAVLLEQVWAVLGSKRHRRYMSIWLDLASGAARGLQPHRAVASAIADGYLHGWPVAWSLKVRAYRLYRRRSFWLRSKACTPSPLLAGQLSQRLP
jgi:hypothetical protein